MEWQGATLRTYGEIFNGLQTLKTTEEADEFYTLYLAALKTSDELAGKTDEEMAEIVSSNLGYLLGYGSEEDRLRIQGLFSKSVVHPIFGGKPAPPPEATFALGAAFAEAARARAEERGLADAISDELKGSGLTGVVIGDGEDAIRIPLDGGS
ncbi:MAG: hypothetical protein ABW167_07775 [Baekduia sp.]